MVTVEAGHFDRPSNGLVWRCECPFFPFSGRPAWQTGATSDSTLDVKVPHNPGELKRVSILGVFAKTDDVEAFGTHGGSIQLWNEDRPMFSVEMTAGQHYTPCEQVTPAQRSVGDGTGLETMGRIDLGDLSARVDLLTVDLPENIEATTLRFRGLSKKTHFIVFDVFFHFEPIRGCPFHSKSGGVSLAELGAVVRLGDRQRLGRALNQLERSILRTQDLDEARGLALTFLAIVTAATLEMGGSRSMHRVQLESARKLDQLTTQQEIAREALIIARSVAEGLMQPSGGPSSHLIDQALAIVNRNYAKDMSYEDISAELGLSTSHFRHLFKEATGQPFHRYIIALRLEKAKRMLIDFDLPVTEVAAAVGFSGLAHFSRAFTQRFQVAPSSIRRVHRVLSSSNS